MFNTYFKNIMSLIFHTDRQVGEHVQNILCINN